jgi:hypothetical protein
MGGDRMTDSGRERPGSACIPGIKRERRFRKSRSGALRRPVDLGKFSLDRLAGAIQVRRSSLFWPSLLSASIL